MNPVKYFVTSFAIGGMRPTPNPARTGKFDVSQASIQTVQPAHQESFRFDRGTCHALFAYDVGRAIDLDAVQRLITTGSQRERIRRQKRAPRYFAFEPEPLRVTQSADPIQIGSHATQPFVDLILYDFGAVSVTYHIPISGDLSTLVDLAHNLYENERLLADSHRAVEQLLSLIRPAVAKSSIPEFVEDYVIYRIDPPPDLPSGWHSAYASILAGILRAERDPISREQIDDAMSCCVSFGPGDVAVIDWNAAFVFDDDADDVLAVLDYANVELLEVRFLDHQLDASMDEAYRSLSQPRRRLRHLFAAPALRLRRVAELQVDSAMLFEGVNNTLKLLGDQYLARIYRTASQRFHLPDWDASILRKLHTLDSLYQKLSDQVSAFRMEALEWIIIILIVISIALPFIPGMPSH